MKISPFAPQSTPELPVIDGVTFASCNAGIRYKSRDDVLLMKFAKTAQVAGAYTRSQTAAAPVLWCRSACQDGHIEALYINSGNANAFTGQRGLDDAARLCEAIATHYGTDASQIMMSSTGVIGEFLPVEKMLAAMDTLYQNQTPNGWNAAAKAIMTTDTFAKCVTRTTHIDGVEVKINGIAKGSGMIAPNMATMLGYIVTDATLPASVIQTLLLRNTQKTFNCITVDGDTSTNDTVLMVATGARAHAEIDNAGDARLDDFKVALHDLMRELAILIVKDGEGTTKFITIEVSGAKDNEAARQIGLAIGNSPLVKTAFAAEDANWGRIVMAVGKSEQWINQDKLRITLGDVLITEGAHVHPDYREADADKVMENPEFTLYVDVGVGTGEATIWTTDLTETYIKINANYRS
jgi:glutamate N-acetyltransferase / amino-acid N-acetyltransferase